MPEQERHISQETHARSAELASERAKELARKHEAQEDREASEQRAERATAEAKEMAQSSERPPAKEKEDAQDYRPLSATKSMRAKSYQHTMSTIQTQMSPVSRTFSKVIHNPIIEKTSEVIGSTIVRPSAVLAGSFTAFVAVAALFATAKFVGFSLQGSETIAAFVAGWLVGILYDLVRLMITGRR